MTQPSPSGTVRVEVSGNVGTVVLDRPEGMNALTVAMKVALLDAVRSVREDPAVRAVVLHGSGRAFCVGQDLREHAALLDAGDPAPLSTVREHYNPVITALATMPKPVVAAVNGTAAGAGLGLACACDFRIGAQGSRWTTAFTGIGLTADSGLSWTLPRLVGAAKATALLMLAEPFTTEQAFEMGLLTAVVPSEQVLPAAQELAARLARGPDGGVRGPQAVPAGRRHRTLDQALAEEDRQQTRAGASADHAAAVRSFLAKQAPVFAGRSRPGISSAGQAASRSARGRRPASTQRANRRSERRTPAANSGRTSGQPSRPSTPAAGRGPRARRTPTPPGRAPRR